MHNYNNNSLYPHTRYILIGLLIVAGIYLVVDHGQHLLPYLPFTFLFGCLFMHMFMHGGHGGHKSKNRKVEDKQNDEHTGHTH